MFRRQKGPVAPKLMDVHILVSTAGVLPPEPVAEFVGKLAGSDRVTVMSVVQAPRDLPMDLAAGGWQPFAGDDDPGSGSGSGSGSDPPGEMERYIEELGNRRVGPMLVALRGRGVRPDAVFVEADDVAQAIVETAESAGAETIIMGATRSLFTEAAWKSVSMKVAEATNLPILLIPAPGKAIPDDSEH